MNLKQNTHRILIIDDNESIHNDIRNIILEKNADSSVIADFKMIFNPGQTPKTFNQTFIIDSAYQSAEGINFVKKSLQDPYAIIIVDVRMPPGEDGVQTIKKIFKIDDQVQIVLCTAFSDYSWDKIFEEVGETDRLLVLKKPFDIIEIRQLVCSLITKWELLKKLKNQVNNLHSIVKERTTHLEETKTKLEQIVSLVKATLESTTDGILVINAKLKILDFNLQFMKNFDFDFHPQIDCDATIVFNEIEKKLEQPLIFRKTIKQIIKNNNREYFLELPVSGGQIIEFYSRPLILDESCLGSVFTFRDVTVRKRISDTLLLQDQALQASMDGVVIIDRNAENFPIIYANSGFNRIIEYRGEEIIGISSDILLQGKCSKEDLESLHVAMKKKENAIIVLHYKRQDGVNFWGELHFSPIKNKEKVTHYVGIIIDITKNKEMESKILQQANYDSLTGLPNRKLGLEELENAIKKVKDKKHMLALLFLDLDRFKIVNDTLGHHIGDELLKIAASRIKSLLRPSDFVARLGGDEFIVITDIKNNKNNALNVVERVVSVFNAPFNIESFELHITPSIGVCIYPEDGKDSRILLKKADIAMYIAKKAGRNGVKFYNANNNVIHTLDIENKIYNAIKKSEFYLVYQPIIDINTNKTIGVEALLRWNQPQLGILLPSDFLQITEDTGLIIPIGEWVMRQACMQAKKWLDTGLSLSFISVNLSANQFKNKNFLSTVQKILEETGLESRYLALELTENFIFESGEVDAILEALHNLGVKIFIDDFGTGYSNLLYFAQHPIDTIKIDKSFLQDMKNSKFTSLIQVIITISQSFKINIIAEGVENIEQLQFLKQNNCNLVQGYYFCKPLEVAACTRFLTE